ncbi:hypothetical protein GCM10027020_33460 [Nocardioides salsibiostraticola]
MSRFTSRWVAVLCAGLLSLALLAVLPAGPAAAAADPQSDHVQLPQQCLTTEDTTPGDPIVCNLNTFDKFRPTLVLWGDSHMWMMIPAIEKAVRGKPVNLVTFIMGACPPGNPALNARTRRNASPCDLTNDRAMRFVRKLQKKDRPVSVILGSFWGIYLQSLKQIRRGERPSINAASAQFFRRSTPALFKWLGKKGVHVDVNAQGPAVPADEPDCDRGTFPWNCGVARSRAYFAERASDRFLARNIGKLRGDTRYIDISPAFCNATTCRARSHGIYSWWDKLHISATKSATLKRFFIPTAKEQARRYRPARSRGGVGQNCRIPIIRKPCIPAG